MGENGKRNRRRRDYDDRSDNRNNFKRRQMETNLEPSGSGSDGLKPVVFRIICPDTVIGSVIGKGGKVINTIRHETRAKVKVMDPYLGSDKRVITVSSPGRDHDWADVDELSPRLDPICPAQEAMIKVHEAIVDALANARENENKNSGKEEVWLLVPASQAAGVIGKGGSTIKRVRSMTRAAIKVSPKDPADATHSCALEFDNFLHIAGEPESVKRALLAISTIMCKFLPKEEIPLEASLPQDLQPSIIIPSDVPVYPSGGFYQPTDPARPGLTPHMAELPPFPDTAGGLFAPPVPVATMPPTRTEELLLRVLCPRNKIGRVIGKGGSTVKSIRQSTGARIDVDDNYKEVDASLITVVSAEGTNDIKSAGVETVLMLQEKINDEDNKNAVMQILVPKKIIGCLIGKGGSIINDMRKKTNADIHITKDDPKRAGSLDELVQVSGEVVNVRDALVNIVLRLREDALRDREEIANSSRDTSNSKPVHPPVDVLYPSSGLSLSSGLPSAPHHLGYDRRANLDVDRGLGVYPNTGMYGFSSLPVDDSRYGMLPSYSSKAFVGALPYVEMVIPGGALPKVLGKGGANLDNIRRISGARVEIVESKSSHYDRIAQISGTPQQQQSAEDLIKAFILST
ncbi:RNA-binding KH domain-containing protein [Rhynchospora pubera]|uniref:RNA-binding KH domain-containing protein n=1 Tax=Rhynchospora pubera TaxID=906938 RepID=A0AAV8E2A9_9POAL|nr:RNA-binding KH domain-containing protein [Rhynchospora pubera]